jgi:tyrosinase
MSEESSFPLRTRRDVLLAAAGGTAALSLNFLTGGCESLKKAIENRPRRRCIVDGDPLVAEDLVYYAAAVTAMKALPSDDPRNWNRQADIHAEACRHGSWFFLPWHRAYLFEFEAICRKLSGAPKTWGLPYWNWSNSPKIPSAFWSGALSHTPRTATAASSASNAFVGPAAIDSILGLTGFTSFAGTNSGAGQLESSPHNYMHNFVGGTMASYLSPRDPIFWCHHNMVEYLWVKWNLLGNDNTDDSTWMDQVFTDFVDADGAAVELKVALTMLFPLLSYQFVECGAGAEGLGPISGTAEFRKLEAALKKGAPVSIRPRRSIDLMRELTIATGERTTVPAVRLEPTDVESALRAKDGERALLTISHAELPRGGDVFLRVFVNHPEATAQTPVTDPHYAGSVHYFVDPRHAANPRHAHGADSNFLVDLTATLQRLARAGQRVDPQNLSFQLIAVPLEARDTTSTELKISRVRLSLAPVDPRRSN